MMTPLTSFKQIPPQNIENVFKLIGQDWMLVCAGDNAMTASWGCMGVLWNKPVCTVFIRPQRHTYTMTESNDRLALAFFDESYRTALRHFGTTSGRDEDKFAATGLTRAHHENGTLYPAEARMVIFCRKLYSDMLRKDAFCDPSPLAHYTAGDFHRMYVCVVEEIWVKK